MEINQIAVLKKKKQTQTSTLKEYVAKTQEGEEDNTFQHTPTIQKTNVLSIRPWAL